MCPGGRDRPTAHYKEAEVGQVREALPAGLLWNHWVGSEIPITESIQTKYRSNKHQKNFPLHVSFYPLKLWDTHMIPQVQLLPLFDFQPSSTVVVIKTAELGYGLATCNPLGGLRGRT